MNYYNTPRLPRQLLHPLIAVEQVRERAPGGQHITRCRPTVVFLGAVLPLSNRDWEQLPEGSYTENSCKVYTDDSLNLQPGQLVIDSRDAQQYTVKTLLEHNSIHPLLRYIVERVVK